MCVKPRRAREARPECLMAMGQGRPQPLGHQGAARRSTQTQVACQPAPWAPCQRDAGPWLPHAAPLAPHSRCKWEMPARERPEAQGDPDRVPETSACLLQTWTAPPKGPAPAFPPAEARGAGSSLGWPPLCWAHPSSPSPRPPADQADLGARGCVGGAPGLAREGSCVQMVTPGEPRAAVSVEPGPRPP